MDEHEIITATEASRSFSEVLHRVCYGGESFVIKKGSRLMARIVPVGPVEAAEARAPQAEAITPPQRPVTEEEAEFYEAWMEQVRNATAEAE